MILQALYDYYQILLNDPDVEIAEPGYSAAKISFALNLSSKGELLDILPFTSKYFDGKKERERTYRFMVVPEQVKKTGINPLPNFLWDSVPFMLGISDKDTDDPEWSRKRFESFKKHNIALLSKANCDSARAIITFLNQHDPTSARQHPIIARHLDDLLKGGFLIFWVNGKDVSKDPEIRRAWDEYKSGEDAAKMQCLVTGKIEPIARLHPSIQGVRDANSTGASLVGFNERAYESYNRIKGQGLNSPVSQRVASGYGVALNYLLSDQNPNRKMYLGDTTVAYWADTPDKRYASAFYSFLNPEFQQGQEESEPEENTGKRKRAREAEREMGEVAESVRQGKAIDLAKLREGLDDSTRFYVLGLASNVSRLAVRFFLTEPFGVFAERIMQHYDDLQIEKEYANQPAYISPYRILAECVSPKVTQRDDEVKKSWSLLGGAFMRSILTGAPYPEGLYAAMLNRIRHDSDETSEKGKTRSVKINYIRAAYIKAHLIRKFRRQGQNPYQEALQMSLNESYTHPAYVLGRLFAVLEKAQREAIGQNINATIKDRYFTSACASPASVFPTLLRLSHHWTTKAEYGGVLDRKIQDLLGMLPAQPLPPRLSLDEQGVFVLGYYHQRAAFYAKKDNGEDASQADDSQS
jgi:CRISPR-associated protein Csd1